MFRPFRSERWFRQPVTMIVPVIPTVSVPWMVQ
jgi:hypothetical protein